MFKQLGILLFNLIVYPENAWKSCSEEQDTDDTLFFKSYLNPILGMIALFAFVGILLYRQIWDVQIAIKQVIKETVPYFVGYYIAVFALSRLSMKFFEEELPDPICERFTGYASAAIYAVAMFHALFPAFPFVQLLTIYTFYIVWQGAIHYLQIKEDYLIKFTIFASILIILAPLIVQVLLKLTMPGL